VQLPALVLIARFYPLRARAITASSINQLSPDRFKDFWRWFRKFYKFLQGNTASDRASEFWLPPPKTEAPRNCVGHALLQGPPDRGLAARVRTGKLSHGLASRVAFGNASRRGSRPDKRPRNSEAGIEDTVVGSADAVAFGGAQA
jgi:hypothetical protein